jgi:hypothetical protein
MFLEAKIIFDSCFYGRSNYDLRSFIFVVLRVNRPGGREQSAMEENNPATGVSCNAMMFVAV